jgi:hypothetical protein
MEPTAKPRMHRRFVERLIEGDTYGALLILILVTYVLMDAIEDSLWGRAVISVFFGGILLLTLYTSKVHRRVIQVATVVVVLFLLANFAFAAFGREPHHGASMLVIVLVLICPIIVLVRIFRHPIVNIETVLGAIDAYLLMAITFAGIYRFLDSIDGPFFVQIRHPNGIKYLYFSFVTITTLGFGDLSPNRDSGRVAVSIEALLGQIFLVTIVAVLIASFARARGGSQTGTAGDEGPS